MKSIRTYIAIDLKSFYASVECVERNLDPLTTNLVVADASRTEKTICLAVSPSLKQYGIPGRPRLFEVVQKVNQINEERKSKAPKKQLHDYSDNQSELEKHPEYGLAYITAVPQMARYIAYSAKIYDIYLKYIAPEDIHVYSIDEVFMDVTKYLATYQMDAKQLAMTIILDVLKQTGITATAGIGTNMYLAKVALDIEAKHVEADENGVRIAALSVMQYRQKLWNHRPLTDFWRVGRGYAKRLEENGIYTMGDIAKCSLGDFDDHYNEDLLYQMFGINAELLIDHAWGYEPCTMAAIKNYRPSAKSVGSGQVLHCPYDYQKARLVVKEMVDELALSLVAKDLVTDQIVLSIGYDRSNPHDDQLSYSTDLYGRQIPKHAHGTVHLSKPCASAKLMIQEVLKLYDNITSKQLLIRRINITASKVQPRLAPKSQTIVEQLDLFTDYKLKEQQEKKLQQDLSKELEVQKAMLKIKKKYGKNSVLKGMNLEEGATTKDRNEQIGGHKA